MNWVVEERMDVGPCCRWSSRDLLDFTTYAYLCVFLLQLKDIDFVVRNTRLKSFVYLLIMLW